MGIYDKRYHICDIRWGWTEEELVENERLVLEERTRAPVVYSNERYIAKRDYSEWMRFGFTEEEAKQLFLHNMLRRIPNSLMVQTFMKKVMKWLVG